MSEIINITDYERNLQAQANALTDLLYAERRTVKALTEQLELERNTVHALSEQLESVRADAARYRFISARMQIGSIQTMLPLYKVHYWHGYEPAYEYRTIADAIDADMKAGGAA